MKSVFQFLVFLLYITNSFSQSDSLLFTRSQWKSEELTEGVIWKSFHFQDTSLFDANLNINFIEFEPLESPFKLKISTSDSLQKTSELSENDDALAAVNGSFFRMKADDIKNPDMIGKNRSVVYMRINGEKITDNILEKGNKRKNYQKGAIVIQDDDVLILKAIDSLISWEASIDGLDILTSGPMLLKDGLLESVSDEAFNKNRHPRTAIGKKQDGTIILFVVDGRSSYSYGLSIPELQKCLYWIGCVDALNLDGGGSTTMYINNKDFKGVINCPSDNKVFDHEGERAVANAILIVKRK